MPVIPFEQIDNRLDALGLNRAWLAEVTPYSADYLRTVLAPNSTRRTERVQRIISDAILRAEAESAAPPAPLPLPDRLTIEASHHEVLAWQHAANADNQIVSEWAVEKLNEAAAEWQQSRTLRVAEDPTPYRSITKTGTHSGKE